MSEDKDSTGINQKVVSNLKTILGLPQAENSVVITSDEKPLEQSHMPRKEVTAPPYIESIRSILLDLQSDIQEQSENKTISFETAERYRQTLTASLSQLNASFVKNFIPSITGIPDTNLANMILQRMGNNLTSHEFLKEKPVKKYTRMNKSVYSPSFDAYPRTEVNQYEYIATEIPRVSTALQVTQILPSKDAVISNSYALQFQVLPENK